MSDSKRLIEKYFDSMTGRSKIPITKYFSDEIVWHLPPAHPFGGPFLGIPSVLRLMDRGGALFKFGTIVIDLHAIISEGNDVAAHFRLSAKTQDEREYANEYMFRFQCNGKKIVAVWEFLDTYYLHKLGMFD